MNSVHSQRHLSRATQSGEQRGSVTDRVRCRQLQALAVAVPIEVINCGIETDLGRNFLRTFPTGLLKPLSSESAPSASPPALTKWREKFAAMQQAAMH